MGGAGWDCDDGTHTTFSSGAYVTRTPVTQVSDWTIGNGVTPTAATLTAFRAGEATLRLSAFAVCALIGVGLILRRRASSQESIEGWLPF
jgi:hypothetical protein